MKKAAAFGLAAAVLAAGVLGINGGFGTIIADVQAEGGKTEPLRSIHLFRYRPGAE